MFGKALLGILGVCLVIFAGVGILVYESGILIVDVQDKAAGHHFYVPVPMLLADAGLNLVPKATYRQMQRELAPHRNLLMAVSRELANCPDGRFVEVETAKEHVVVQKSGDDFLVDVVTPDEEVHLKVPLSPTERILGKLTDTGI